jgi:hypothetical protein
MKAWVEGDGPTLSSLFSPEAVVYEFAPPGGFVGLNPEQLTTLHDWYRSGGWVFHNLGCQGESEPRDPAADGGDPAAGDGFDCTYTFDTKVTRSLGWEPLNYGHFLIIGDSEIVWASNGLGFDIYNNTIGSVFAEWVERTHPDDYTGMFNAGVPQLDASSIELWERYTDEFLDSREDWPPSVLERLDLAEYIWRATSICWAARDEAVNTPESTEPEAERAAFDAAAKSSEEALAQLRELDPPPGVHGDRVNEVYALMEQQIDNYRQPNAGDLWYEVAQAIDEKGTVYGLDLCPTILGL